MSPERHDDYVLELDELLAASAKLTKVFPDAVLVGGAASSVHARHRFSRDIDFILPNMRDRFESVFTIVDSDPEWTTARVRAPVVIMGNFHGVETTLRQLIRKKPLETCEVITKHGPVNVPTLEEMIRIKAWLVLTRNAYRDYLDLAALSDIAGDERTAKALGNLDSYYIDVDSKKIVREVSPSLQLMKQLFDSVPSDLNKLSEIESYKSTIAPWKEPSVVLEKCKKLGNILADQVFVADPKIENALERINGSTTKAQMPKYPSETHEAHVSTDGTVIVIRQKSSPEVINPKVDNPIGPAIIDGNGERYAVEGRIVSFDVWRNSLSDDGTQNRPK